jgi:hypothetical protein
VTDEGQMGSPMDAVEMANAMRGIASAARAFYEQLVEDGFSETEALHLTCAYVAGMAGGKIA